MKTILLYSLHTDKMSYYDDWIDAFREHPDFKADCINVIDAENKLSDVLKKIKNSDLIILHYSMNGDTLKYLDPFVSALKDRKGKLVSFVGNEVNLPTISMLSKIKNLQELEPELIATQLLQEAGDWLYEDCKKSKVISLPHALNPKVFFSRTNIKKRKIDIGTRSARYGVYIGDNDRNEIINFFSRNKKILNLSIDLCANEKSPKRFNREQWAVFLSSCKATLSTEAGSFFLEKDDQIVTGIQKFLQKQSSKIVLPKEGFARNFYRSFVPESIRRALILFLKDKLIEYDSLDENWGFDEIYEKFFLYQNKCPAYSKAISSRHFDAIGTKTMHIMYPGRYNDILIPGEHYFELKRDHSNIDELNDCLMNHEYMAKITTCAYEHVISAHTHINRLDELIYFLR